MISKDVNTYCGIRGRVNVVSRGKHIAVQATTYKRINEQC